MKQSAIDKLRQELKKDNIEFREIQETFVIPNKTIRIPTIIYKPLEVDILSTKNFRCRFDKHDSNTNRTETIIRDFVYFAPMYNYIKKFVKGII